MFDVEFIPRNDSEALIKSPFSDFRNRYFCLPEIPANTLTNKVLTIIIVSFFSYQITDKLSEHIIIIIITSLTISSLHWLQNGIDGSRKFLQFYLFTFKNFILTAFYEKYTSEFLLIWIFRLISWIKNNKTTRTVSVMFLFC